MPTLPRRFIILASQRTGSNLLRSLLDSHPDVTAYAEVFLKDHSWFENQHGPKDSPALVAERDADPVAFAQKHVFRDYEDSVKAVGFKLFYQHAPEGEHALWRWLDGMPDLGVIHLRRKNLLRQLVSFEVAKATNVYRSNSPKTPRVSHDEVALEIGRKHCETFMRRTTDAARAACARLSNCEHLDLTYEEMTESPEATEATMRRTLDFLGLRHIALQSQLRKQVNRPVRDLVRNYDELASAFAKTEWADCFDE